MQILELCLYGRNGEVRVVTFRPGVVNIITGKSKSGKSAVGDIIDYCMGGQGCSIATGVVRDAVAWYGLLLLAGHARAFVARKSPEPGKQTSHLCYCEVGEDVESPEVADFVPNTNYEGVEDLLSRLVGIGENVHQPGDGESRDPLEASIRHALFYCFQSQDEIAARNVFFHRQGEPMMTNAARDTLPYLLGAVDEDAIMLAFELRAKRRELKLLRKRVEEEGALGGADVGRAVSLLAEATSAGLIEDDDDVDKTDFEAVYDLLRSVELGSVDVPADLEERLSALQEKLRERQRELADIRSGIDEAKAYMSDAAGYTDELGHQRTRLTSIGLFERLDFDAGRCPLCSGRLNPEPPGVAILKESIKSLDRAIGGVEKERPQLQRYVVTRERAASAAKEEIALLKAEIDGICNQLEDVQVLRSSSERQAKVYGRISYWLESVRPPVSTANAEAKIEDLEGRIKSIENELDNDSIRERTVSSLSTIQNDMTRWAEELEMEYAGSPYRIDMGKVTVVADLMRPVPLREMGSASNWLGAHLIAMFGLHRYFATNSRPVPGFLFLDQPSQAYFPEGSTADEDMDVRAVARTYEFIRKRVSELKGGMQVIVVDHAKLNDDSFKSETIEDWRDAGSNLVPTSWCTAISECGDEKG